jgi:competence protein ComEA
MRAVSESRGFGNPLHAAIVVGLVAFCLQMVPSLKDSVFSQTPVPTPTTGPCMYEVLEDGMCTNALFLSEPETVEGIVRHVGRRNPVRWAGCRGVIPCGSTIKLSRDSSAVSVGIIPGSHLVAAGKRLDINRAGQADLASVPGIGKALAERIVQERARRGGFASVQDLRGIRGIGQKKLAIASEWLSVVPAAYPSAFRSCESIEE